MKSSYIKGFGTDYNEYNKMKRRQENEIMRGLDGSVIYKDGLAFVVPRDLHFLNGRIKTTILNKIRNSTVKNAIELSQQGVVIVKANMGEAIAI